MKQFRYQLQVYNKRQNELVPDKFSVLSIEIEYNIPAVTDFSELYLSALLT